MGARKEKHIEINVEVTSGLVDFFDLLARFDFEDKQKEKSEINTGPLVSAPKGSMLGSDQII
jgi:hypothetical protein